MRKLNITIIAGLLVAVLGGVLVFIYGHNADNRVARGKRTVPVLVSTGSAGPGATAAALASIVHVEQVPEAYAIDNYLSSLQQVPATQVLLGALVKGAQLSSSMFGAPGSVAATVAPPKGMVDIAIKVGLVPGVAKYITPGSTVDMFFTDKTTQSTKLFTSGVKVVSVSVATTTTQTQGQQAGSSVGDDVLCLIEVTPDLAQKIVSALENGDIYLALDAKGDTHSTSHVSKPSDLLKSK